MTSMFTYTQYCHFPSWLRGVCMHTIMAEAATANRGPRTHTTLYFAVRPANQDWPAQCHAAPTPMHCCHTKF
eukprot:1625216-Pleurochrysis_carterae.AAC.6